MHVMIQATYLEDWVNLPNGVYVVKTYTELHNGSRNVSVVLHNLTGKPVHLAAGRAVARVVTANAIPDVTPSPKFLKKLDEMEPPRDPPKKLTVEERQKLLLEVLQKESWLDKVKEWPPELALKFERMLMEHHNIFSLDKNKIGCTDAAEHVIELRALEGMIPADSSSSDGGGMGTYPGDAGWGRNPPVSISLVQCNGFSL